ncbi:MAG: integrase family protein [Roseicyclus sp.]|nr:integrase family protein [Roseicyclus sp.]MBO6626263.1 integrase family protein [Roseicyclus sp.]MBO6923948.1 integrase family protein [Roseicyclus sp.]
MPHTELINRPSIAKLKPTTGKATSYSDPSLKNDPDARGIRLMVGATTKTWVITRRIDDKVRTVTLGPWPELPTVFAARDIAKEKMAAVNTGTDAQSTGINTLRDAMENHIANSTASADTHDYYRTQIDRHLPNLFAKDVEKVTLADIENALRPHLRIGDDGKRRATATYGHLRQIVSTAFKQASAHRRIPNVADGLGRVKPVPPKNRVQFDVDEHWPILDMIEAKKERNLLVGAGWELMLFTALRSKNAKELRWADVDLERKRLRVVGLKNDEDVSFPLCDRLVDLLGALPRTSEWVFPHRNDPSRHVASFGRELVADGVRVAPHDMRRLFTTAARRLRLSPYVIDQFRGDTEKGVQGVYDQGSMDHATANQIAQQIEVECGSLPDSNVVQIAEMR